MEGDAVVGMTFTPQKEKKGTQTELENVHIALPG